jgi:hypothetical protein
MKMGQMMILFKGLFWCKFYMDLSVFSCLEMFKQTLGSKLSIGKSKLRFWGEKWVFPVTGLSQLATASWRRVGGELEVLPVALLAMASDLLAGASCTAAASPVSRSCVFFTRFCFELAFGVNMKVVDNLVSFPEALV